MRAARTAAEKLGPDGLRDRIVQNIAGQSKWHHLSEFLLKQFSAIAIAYHGGRRTGPLR